MSVWENWLAQDPVPTESIYLWMYRAGLHAMPEQELMSLLQSKGKVIRSKDIANYNRGLRNSYFTDVGGRLSGRDSYFRIGSATEVNTFTQVKLDKLPNQIYQDYACRWVPCDADNKPMIKWSQGCLTKEQAMAWPGAVYLAENLYETPFVVFDIDGDHNDILNVQLINEFYELICTTHALCKQRTVEAMIMEPSERYHPVWDAPTSFHLTYTTNKIIPTKHFTAACIDLLGNKQNQLRYRKTKVWNGLYPRPLTEEVWDKVMRYCRLMDLRVRRIK